MQYFTVIVTLVSMLVLLLFFIFMMLSSGVLEFLEIDKMMIKLRLLSSV